MRRAVEQMESDQISVDRKACVEAGQFHRVEDLHADLVLVFVIVGIVIIMLGVNQGVERECGILLVDRIKKGHRIIVR
jgi:hypothetical protein